MKKDLLHTPEGVRDIYGNECAKRIVLQERLRDVCKTYGYSDIQTPSIEFFDVFSRERGSVPSNEMFKMFDRYGNTLCLRPDMTPSIARATAKYFEDHILPVKLCYIGNTFINTSKYYQGKLKESTSIGAELIDDDSIYADLEIISMVIDCMKNAGITEFQVEIGNVAFFKGLLSEAGVGAEDEEELVELIQNKNYFGVEELLNSLDIDKHIAEVLLELPQMFGSVEILNKARELTNIKSCNEAVNRLIRLYELLKLTGYENFVSFDLGEITSHAYYTGIVFHAYTFGTGEPVIIGGRYDKLIGQFGKAKPSIGFSINVDNLMMAIDRQNIKIPVDINGYLIVFNESNLNDAIKLSSHIRATGSPALMISYNDAKSIEQYVIYATNSQLSKICFITDDYIKDGVKIINCKDMSEERRSFADMLGGNN